MLATSLDFQERIMSDQAEMDQAGGAQFSPIQVNAQYIKDLSFEVPGAPNVFVDLAGAQPDLTVRVDLNAQPMGGNSFEVVLQLAVDAKVGDKVAFIIELTYAGLFTLNVPEEHVQPVLLIEAPRLLFPFARAIISEVTGGGGLPPLMMQPIDFAALYRSRMEQMAQAEPQGNA
jgi:preprotein translocase subunit SecB